MPPSLELQAFSWVSSQRAWGPWSIALQPQAPLLLTGPSGNGKTLLVRALLGETVQGLQSRGARLIHGKSQSPWELPVWWRDHVGVVLQEAQGALSPCCRVGDLLTERLRQQGHSTRDSLTMCAPWLEQLDLLSIPDLCRRYPHQLSGGQCQRLALVMALAHRPQILICDEPTSALDPRMRQRVGELLLELSQTMAILCISHDQDVLEILQRAPQAQPYTMRDGALLHGLTTPSSPDQHFPSSGSSLICALERVQGVVQGRALFAPLLAELHRGEIVGIAGPSGIGKSTLAKALAGLDIPLNGTVHFPGGRPHVGDRRIQIVFQNPYAALNPFLRVGTQLLEVCSDQKVVLEMMERLLLPAHLFMHRPQQLSGGQLQRFCIARALLAEPELLILDEPTSALDEKNRLELGRLLQAQVEQQGLGVLVISHDLPWLHTICHRVIELQPT